MPAKGSNIVAIVFAVLAVSVMLASCATMLSQRAGDGAPLDGGVSLRRLAAPAASAADSATRASFSVADYEVEYALITNQALAPSFQPLVDWKISKGLKAKLYTTDGAEGIYAKYPNGDSQKRIHDFLHDLDGNSAGLQWVCLGGDNETIPARLLYTGAASKYGAGSTSEWQDRYWSDQYYSGLGSSWDADGDGVYGESGEEDISPEAYVGRLPAKTSAEASRMATRTISYERDIASGDWLGKAFLAASLMDAPNVMDNPATTSVDEGYNDYKDNAYKCIQQTKAYMPEAVVTKELYDYAQLEGGHYANANDTLSLAAFKAEINKGYGMVDYVGQAYYGGDALAEYYAANGTVKAPNGFKFLYDYGLDALTASNGAKAPLVIFATCDSGDFTQDDDSDMEALLKAQGGGAIGLISFTGRAYRGENEDGYSFGSWWLNEQLVGQFYDGTSRQGKLVHDVKYDYYTKIYDPEASLTLPEAVLGNIYGLGLLGDPETDVYTSVPQTLAVQSSAAYLNQNSMQVTVKDTLGKGVGGATVSLFGQGLQIRGTTGTDGKLLLNFTASQLGELNLTVTKHDFKANVTKVQVVQRPKDLSVAPSDIALSASEAAPGDQITLDVTVHNLADVKLGPVEATLKDTYLDGAEQRTDTVQELTFDIEASSQKHLSLAYNATAAGDHTLTFTLDPQNLIAESNEADNTASVIVHVDAPPVFSDVPKVLLKEDTVLLSALNLGEHATDPDNASYELGYSLVFNRDDNCLVSVAPDGIVSIIPQPQWSGSTEAVVAVFDGLLSDVTNISVTVEPVSDPPELSALPDRVAYVDEAFSLFATASDPDPGEALTYSDDSGLAAIDPSSGKFSFIPYKDDIGVHKVTITVTDPTGLTDSKTFNLTVKQNDRPMIEQKRFTAKTGSEFKQRIVVKNAPANATYVFSDSTDLFNIDPATGVIEFTPKQKDKGTHSVRITARDQHGNSVYGIIYIEIEQGADVTTWFMVALIIIVLIALGAVIFYFFVNPRMKAKDQPAGKAGGGRGQAKGAEKKGGAMFQRTGRKAAPERPSAKPSKDPKGAPKRKGEASGPQTKKAVPEAKKGAKVGPKPAKGKGDGK